jgi:hypothetical protein
MDWGVDNKLDSVALCSPFEEVEATYFVGLSTEETNRSEMSSDIDAAANQTTTVDFGDVIVEVITGDNVSSEINATLYVNATDFFTDVWGITMLPSSLGRYVTIDAGESLEGNLTSFRIRVYYLDSEVVAAGLTESQLRLYRYNETTDTWVLLTTDLDWVFGSGVNTVSNYVWANTSRLSTYGIWEGTTTTTTTTVAVTTTRYRGGGGGGAGGGGGTSGAKPLIGCFDGIKNCHGTGCETGVDCGGPCQPCISCEDGIQNQGETGIDCGGPCAACKTTTTQVSATIDGSIMITLASATTTTAAPESKTATGFLAGLHLSLINTLLLLLFLSFVILIYIYKRNKGGKK